MRTIDHGSRLMLATVLVVALLVAPATLTAAKGGNGGGNGGGKPGGGGGGGEEPPPNPEIIYSVEKWKRNFYTYDLRVMNADGTNDTLLLAEAAKSLKFEIGRTPEANWSPDATQITYNATVSGDVGIWIVNADGSNPHKIATTQTYYERPVWSPVLAPDGQMWIAFEDRGLGDRDIFVVRPDGTGLTNLTQTADVSEGNPSWNASATAIACRAGHYRSDGTWHGDLFVYPIVLASDGTLTVGTPANLTDVAGSPFQDSGVGAPDFARLSDLIVVQHRDGDRDIWIIDPADPANPVNVTASPDFDESKPSWAPDDSEIVYESNGLFAIAPNGTGQRQLAPCCDSERPDWRR